MAKHEPGMPVAIEIAGKTLEVRYTLRVLKELQKDGINVIRGMSDAIYDPETLAKVLVAGIDKRHGIDLDWVMDNVDTAQLMAIMPDLTFAMTGREIPGPNAPRPVESGTGSPSGPSQDTTSVLVNGRAGG
jgi:hypothetical protein